MEMKQVFSSHVAAVGYDPTSRELHVKYQKGKTAVFMEVPADVAQMVVDAPSVGTALHQYIRGKFAHGYASGSK